MSRLVNKMDAFSSMVARNERLFQDAVVAAEPKSVASEAVVVSIQKLLDRSPFMVINNIVLRDSNYHKSIISKFPQLENEVIFYVNFCTSLFDKMKDHKKFKSPIFEMDELIRMANKYSIYICDAINNKFFTDSALKHISSDNIYWFTRFWSKEFSSFKTSRNACHHLIDDIMKICSLRDWDFDKHGSIALYYNNATLSIRRLDKESGAVTDVRLRNDLAELNNDDDNKYWCFPEFAEAMNRCFWDVDTDFEAAHVLMKMKAQGHKKAFVKGRKSKTGTFTCDLSRLKNENDALDFIIKNSGFYLWNAQGYIIQEYLPTYFEQRHFIYDGKLVATVCSDRNFTFLDARKGKRLDDRVAILTVPEIEDGNFDRGITSHRIDRELSAQFVKASRTMAKSLQSHGMYFYVIDWGLTSRGVTAIEINTFSRSGPYCLDWGWILKAQAKKQERARKNKSARLPI